MRRFAVEVLSVAIICSLADPAFAFTSKGVQTVSVSASGVTDTTSLSAIQVVTQGTADTPTTLTFGTSGNTFRNSGAALKIDLTSNAAGNRLIIYTNNLSGSAVPQAQLDTGAGIDGGGLVGTTDKSQIVPLLWAMEQTNVAHNFGSTVGDDEVFVTDKAHVRTFITVVPGQAKNGTLDNMLLKMCDATATPPIPPTNIVNDGLYTQYFGAVGQNLDVCSNEAGLVTINGVTIAAGAKIPQAEELSKNIAVIAFGFLGKTGTAPNLSTPNPSDTMSITAPFYMPIAADFRFAPAQNYATSTLTVELVTQ